jgi:hypothetical protein
VPGASCFRRSSSLPNIENSMSVNPVMLPPGRAPLPSENEATNSWEGV